MKKVTFIVALVLSFIASSVLAQQTAPTPRCDPGFHFVTASCVADAKPVEAVAKPAPAKVAAPVAVVKPTVPDPVPQPGINIEIKLEAPAAAPATAGLPPEVMALIIANLQKENSGADVTAIAAAIERRASEDAEYRRQALELQKAQVGSARWANRWGAITAFASTVSAVADVKQAVDSGKSTKAAQQMNQTATTMEKINMSKPLQVIQTVTQNGASAFAQGGQGGGGGSVGAGGIVLNNENTNKGGDVDVDVDTDVDTNVDVKAKGGGAKTGPVIVKTGPVTSGSSSDADASSKSKGGSAGASANSDNSGGGGKSENNPPKNGGPKKY